MPAAAVLSGVLAAALAALPGCTDAPARRATPPTATTTPSTPPPGTGTPSPTPDATVTMTTRTRAGREGRNRWTVAYPTLHGLAPAAAARANAVLATGVDEARDLDEDGTASTTDVTAELWRVDERYVTVRVSAAFLPDGGAHGYTALRSFVLDRATGRRVTVRELFPHVQPALVAMSRYARQRLPHVLETFAGEELERGTAPTLESFANIVPLPEGLEVTFEEYQVAAFAAGHPVLTVPWPALPAPALPPPAGEREPAYRDGARADGAVLDAARRDPRVGGAAVTRAQVSQWDPDYALATLPGGDRVALRATDGAWAVVEVGPDAGCGSFPAAVRESLALRC